MIIKWLAWAIEHVIYFIINFSFSSSSGSYTRTAIVFGQCLRSVISLRTVQTWGFTLQVRSFYSLICSSLNSFWPFYCNVIRNWLCYTPQIWSECDLRIVHLYLDFQNCYFIKASKGFLVSVAVCWSLDQKHFNNNNNNNNDDDDDDDDDDNDKGKHIYRSVVFNSACLRSGLDRAK